jgi:UDP-N-acetylglucosamine transferase subunit ALG13
MRTQPQVDKDIELGLVISCFISWQTLQAGSQESRLFVASQWNVSHARAFQRHIYEDRTNRDLDRLQRWI